MEVYYEGMCCVDCILYIANGDLPDDSENADFEERIHTNWPGSENHLVPGNSGENGEHVEEFSRSECDCCGSRLAGERHPFAVLR